MPPVSCMREISALNAEAMDLHKAGKLAEAAAIYDKVLGFTDGQDLTSLHHYAIILAGDGYDGLALSMFYKVLAENAEHVPSWCNLGICLFRLGRFKHALAAYMEAYRLAPEDETVLSNLSGYWVNRGNPTKVIQYARDGLALFPDSPQLHNHLAQGLLEAGEYKEGFAEYEWRWRLPERQKDRRPYAAPLWDGRKIGTLAIHGEQGLGDEIMFMSCLRQVAPRAGRVVLESAKRLVHTFADAFGLPVYPDHASLIAAEGEPDAYIPMGSLPGIVGVPDGKPYLPRPARLGNGRPRVGIAWRGGTDKTHKRLRTLRLPQLRPILEIPGIDFVSVQYGDGGEVDEAASVGVRSMRIGRDFDAAHSAIASCDLIITVQQTAVHQAGAMGIPCWVLTPKGTSWQFTAAHGDRMIWYDSVRLFRQGDDEKWEPVIERIAQELRGQYAVAA